MGPITPFYQANFGIKAGPLWRNTGPGLALNRTQFEGRKEERKKEETRKEKEQRSKKTEERKKYDCGRGAGHRKLGSLKKQNAENEKGERNDEWARPLNAKTRTAQRRRPSLRSDEWLAITARILDLSYMSTEGEGR